METNLIVTWVKACVAEGKFYVEDHALERHPLAEGFTVRQAISSIARSEVVYDRQQDCVCTLCGDVPDLLPLAGFHANFVHTVINYDRISQVIIITMYRPSLELWETPVRRRR